MLNERRLEDSLLPGSIKPDQRYTDWGYWRKIQGIWIPVESEGPSAQDLQRFGFDADESLYTSTRWTDLVKAASQSRVLRVAAAFGAIALGVNSLLENTHSSEASAIGPAFEPEDDGDSYYTNFGEAVITEMDQQNQLTLLHGDGSRDRLNILLLPYNGTTMQMLQEVAQDIFLIPPTDEFKGRTNVYTTNPQEDLKCNQQAICDWDVVEREVKRLSGIHEGLVVIKSNFEYYGSGQGQYYLGRSIPPDIRTNSAVVRLLVIPSEFKQLFAASIAHELWGHAFGWIPDNEGHGDLMDHYSGNNSFSPQHAQFLRATFALAPYNYITPKNDIKVTVSSLSLKAELITPTGTTQKKRWISPANNDGPDITLLRNQEASFEVPAPQIGIGNYILLPDMTYTWKEWSSGYPTALSWNAPQWDNFEGWPGIFFPNTPAEIKVKTPKRDSLGIGLITLAGGQETNDRTPTLTWTNRDTDVFYYEVQLSKDSTFNTDPNTAIAAVYWNLIHGGESKPLNSWTVPDQFPLQLGQIYYWRVRPRVQGDGTPVEWSQIGSFSTPSALKGRTVSMAEYNGHIEELKREQARLNRSRDEHWNWVEREVLTKTEIPLFDNNGQVNSWITYSDNIPLEAYLREEDLTPAA